MSFLRIFCVHRGFSLGDGFGLHTATAAARAAAGAAAARAARARRRGRQTWRRSAAAVRACWDVAGCSALRLHRACATVAVPAAGLLRRRRRRRRRRRQHTRRTALALCAPGAAHLTTVRPRSSPGRGEVVCDYARRLGVARRARTASGSDS